eukprot:362468-Chlamydomonas_euryale.AAC.4
MHTSPRRKRRCGLALTASTAVQACVSNDCSAMVCALSSGEQCSEAWDGAVCCPLIARSQWCGAGLSPARVPCHAMQHLLIAVVPC